MSVLFCMCTPYVLVVLYSRAHQPFCLRESVSIVAKNSSTRKVLEILGSAVFWLAGDRLEGPAIQCTVYTITRATSNVMATVRTSSARRWPERVSARSRKALKNRRPRPRGHISEEDRGKEMWIEREKESGRHRVHRQPSSRARRTGAWCRRAPCGTCPAPARSAAAASLGPASPPLAARTNKASALYCTVHPDSLRRGTRHTFCASSSFSLSFDSVWSTLQRTFKKAHVTATCEMTANQ